MLTRTNWPDVDDVVALSADSEVMHDLDNGHPMTAAHVLSQEMPRLMAHNRRADRLGAWVARERTTGSFLGWFMITPVDQPPRTVELTYRLRRRAWGRGYDVEGMLFMIEIARDAHVSTVIATTMAVDIASRRMMEMAGLKLVHTLDGDAARPTTTAGRRDVNYALDLTMEANRRHSPSPAELETTREPARASSAARLNGSVL